MPTGHERGMTLELLDTEQFGSQQFGAMIVARGIGDECREAEILDVDAVLLS
jgi:hypothetical protein